MERSSAAAPQPLTVIAAERLKYVSACVSVSTGKELPHLPEPHGPVEGHPAAQRHPRGQTEPGLHYTVRRHG